MLRSIRKFSTSVYAKILMGIIIIPFVFWGMGSNFFGGNKNVIVVIEKEKYSIQNFVDYIQRLSSSNQKIKSNQIEEFLSTFIGEQLIKNEIDYFGFKLSDKSLSRLIRYQKDFERENKFSRVEYEKFLLKNNITSIAFESILSQQEKRKQFFDFIGGGIFPSKDLINRTYNNINQKRNIEVINLNNVFKNKINISEDMIKAYYEKNKKKYEEIYKSINLIELTPEKLTDENEFNDMFFKKIDEIDYMIIEGKNLEDVIKKFDIKDVKKITLNKQGYDINLKKINNIPENLIESVFSENRIESILLIEDKDKYFIADVNKSENIQRKINDETVKKNILKNLESETKRKLLTQIISKINKNSFIKSDFDKLSSDENVSREKIILKNKADNNLLRQEIVSEIYAFPEKKVFVIHDLSFTEMLLIYINKIENVTIKENTDDYEKYSDLAKTQVKSSLYSSYDNYIKKKYKIDINYKALEIVKNNFN